VCPDSACASFRTLSPPSPPSSWPPRAASPRPSCPPRGERLLARELSYWVEVNSTASTSEQPENTLVLQILNSSGTVESTTTVATGANNGDSYVEYSANLASYIGQTITIKFTATEVSGGNTQFLEDSSTLNVS
jgi:hypothetical protein